MEPFFEMIIASLEHTLQLYRRSTDKKEMTELRVQLTDKFDEVLNILENNRITEISSKANIIAMRKELYQLANNHDMNAENTANLLQTVLNKSISEEYRSVQILNIVKKLDANTKKPTSIADESIPNLVDELVNSTERESFERRLLKLPYSRIVIGEIRDKTEMDVRKSDIIKQLGDFVLNNLEDQDNAPALGIALSVLSTFLTDWFIDEKDMKKLVAYSRDKLSKDDVSAVATIEPLIFDLGKDNPSLHIQLLDRFLDSQLWRKSDSDRLDIYYKGDFKIKAKRILDRFSERKSETTALQHAHDVARIIDVLLDSRCKDINETKVLELFLLLKNLRNYFNEKGLHSIAEKITKLMKEIARKRHLVFSD